MDLDKLARQLERHEAKRNFPYTDTVGKLTIGVGRNLTDRGLLDSEITFLLQNDIADVVDFLNTNLPWWSSLDDVRQRVLADLAFTLSHKLLDFKQTLGALESHEWDKAADALLASKYATQVGQRAKNLAFMIRTGTDVS
jgi:lysozyme